MLSRKEENMQLQGFVMGVLKSAEFVMKSGTRHLVVQDLINELLDEKLKYIVIKRIAKKNKIDIDWNSLDITIKRTD